MILGSALVVMALAAMWLLRSPARPTPARTTDAPAAPMPSRVHVPIPAVPKAPSPEDAPTGPEPDVRVSAAMAVAETRGYVRMRCHVGEQYESTGDLDIDRPLVRNGWFHASSPDLEGTLAFEIPYDDGQTNGRAHGFTVHWRAETPGSEVPCEVIWPRFAEVTLELTVDGRLVDHDIVALGCVQEVTSHGYGRLTGMVLAEAPCFVQLQGTVDEHAAATLPSLPEHGQLTVRLEVARAREDDGAGRRPLTVGDGAALPSGRRAAPAALN
ncbi:MAG: hypothetical protein H6734_10065 [Alphaproteobacteria bacterium]|nr:hypothetical protein [Alphaproteobacteria bacterium]